MKDVEIKRKEALNSTQLNMVHKLYNNSFDLWYKVLRQTIFNLTKRL
jgi:hypothetical protein